MKKILISVLAALTLAGCLATENRRVKIRRDASDIEGGISIIDTSTQPWWAASTVGVPDDENPWLKYVKPQPEDRWYDPWGQDSLSNYGVEPLEDQIRRLGPPKVEPKAKPKTELRKALEKRLDEFRSREVY